MNRSEYIAIRNKFDLKKKTSALVLHLLQNALLLGAIIGVWQAFPDSWWRLAAVPLTFMLIFRGFGIMHDAVHGAVSKSPYINRIVGVLGGSLCLLPFESWKRSHLKHHQWSGNVEKDPVMALIIVFPKMHHFLQSSISRGWKIWLPVLGFLQHVVFWNLSLRPLFKEPLEATVVVSLAAPLLLWGSLFATVPLEFSLLVLVPALFIYFVGIEVVNLPHHLGLPQHRGDTKFSAWEQYQTARSCIYPKWFAKFVILNFNYHTEHHMFPDAPWYYLDQLHVPVAQNLKENYNTDLYFDWILENKKKDMLEVLAAPEPKVPKKDTAA